jgi:phosphopantothenoylcysteine decarboxylase/phosphopantothenate--cysteine ligase
MYDNLATQRNMERCKSYGIAFVEPSSGLLACGDIGRGKLADNKDIIDMIGYCLEPKPLHRQKVLITAGPTQESMDPVRFLTNHSSGKMGYTLAKKAHQLGADVTLISGPVSLPVPYGVKHIPITSANDMFNEVKKVYEKQDYIIKAAAVSDYRFSQIQEQKIKKSDIGISVSLVKNDDILSYIGSHKTKQIVCGFAMETTNLIDYATDKFNKKNCDLLVKIPMFGKINSLNVSVSAALLLYKTLKNHVNKVDLETYYPFFDIVQLVFVYISADYWLELVFQWYEQFSEKDKMRLLFELKQIMRTKSISQKIRQKAYKELKKITS